MAYNTKPIITDVNGKPVPQYYNQTADQFEPLQGSNGANRVLLYDVNGNPLLTVTNPGVVQLAGTTLSSVVTMQNAATAVGNGTSLPTSGMGVALLAVSGTFTATITFEGQGPDGNWYALNALNRGTGAISTTATAPGLYEINVRGLTAIRARISSYTSGSVTVKGQAQPIPVENGFTQLTGSNIKEEQALPINLISKYELLGNAEKIIGVGTATEWDQNIREIGNVLYEPFATNKRYKLVYSGHQGSYTGTNVYVGLATSEDGKTWTKQGQILSRASEDPYLVKYNGVYYLFVEDKADVPFRNIRLYTSTDLVTWTDMGDVIDKGSAGEWDSQDVSSPVVLIENGTWYMFYEGRGANNPGGAVGLATSTDGINWVKNPNNPVAIANDPSIGKIATVKWASSMVPDDIFKVNGVYYLLVHVWGYRNRWVTAVLTSTDLINWSDPLERPLEFPLGPEETSDGTAMFMYDGNYYLVYARAKGIYRVPIVGLTNRIINPSMQSHDSFIVASEAIRDLTSYATDDLDLSRYKSIEIWVRNTMDQSVKIGLTALPKGLTAAGVAVWDSSTWKIISTSTTDTIIPGDGNWYALSTKWGWLRNLMIDKLRIRYQASATPTTGDLTIVVFGSKK